MEHARGGRRTHSLGPRRATRPVIGYAFANNARL